MIAYTAKDPLPEEEKQKHERKDDSTYVDHNYRFSRLWVIDIRTRVARRLVPEDVNGNEIAGLLMESYLRCASQKLREWSTTGGETKSS